MDEECLHIPRCLLREPYPTPIGPRSLEQTELDCDITKNEAVQNYIEEVLDFLKRDHDETLYDTVEKLTALKQMFQSKGVDGSEFDDIIQAAKTTQKAIDDLQNEDNMYDEDYLDGLLDDDLPPHYWGGEDGNEFIFED